VEQTGSTPTQWCTRREPSDEHFDTEISKPSRCIRRRCSTRDMFTGLVRDPHWARSSPSGMSRHPERGRSCTYEVKVDQGDDLPGQPPYGPNTRFLTLPPNEGSPPPKVLSFALSFAYEISTR
jgi:hypothetical protein